jgi:polysaccharide pyruvyl transferase WcaK-like protein
LNILVDHGSYLNLGDIAMLEGAVARLHHALPDAQLHVVFRNIPTKLYRAPYVTRVPNYEMQPRPEKSLKPFLRDASHAVAIRGALAQLAFGASAGTLPLPLRDKTVTASEFCEPYDALHLVGGGMLNDVLTEQLVKKCTLVLTFAAQRKPIVMSGQQLGPFQNPLFKRALLRTLRAVKFVGVREPTESLALCREAKLEATRYALMGDDAFGITPAGETETRRILSEYGLEPHQFLAFNLRIQRNYAPEFARHAEFLGALAEKISNALHLPILFVPIATDKEQGDVGAAQRVAAHIPTARTVILDRPELSPSLAKGLLGQVRGAVGASYHFCTFAFCGGTPTVNVFDGRYYKQKSEGLTAFWGDARLAYALQDGNVEQAAQHILGVINDNALSEQLKRRAAEALTKWETIFDREARRNFGGDAR